VRRIVTRAAVLAIALRGRRGSGRRRGRRQVLTSYRAFGADPLAERFEREWESFG